MTGGGFELKETEVQAGEGVDVEILSSGVFVTCRRPRHDCGGEVWRSRSFADGTNTSMRFPLWRLQPKCKGCATA